VAVTRKKGFEIIKGKTDTPDVIEVGGKKVKFDKNGLAVVHDKGLADDIEAVYGAHSKTGDKSVFVCEVDNPSDRLPRKTWSFSRIPWKE